MEREQTLQLAKQAGLVDWTEDGNWSAVDCDLVRFAKLVAAYEHKVIAAMVKPLDESLADEILARSNT
jgi:hypothetical protein